MWYSMNRNRQWFVYIVECADKTYYTGITTNINRRLVEHNGKPAGKGAKYTRSRRPVELVCYAVVQSRSEALKLELKIKKLKKSEKINYLKSYGDKNESNKQSQGSQRIRK